MGDLLSICQAVPGVRGTGKQGHSFQETKVKFGVENFEGEKNKDTTGEQERRKHFYFSVLGTCHLFQGNITPWEGLICSESECCGSLLRFFFVLYATEPNFVPTFYDWFPFSINFSNPFYAGYLMHSLLPNFYPINLQDSIYLHVHAQVFTS